MKKRYLITIFFILLAIVVFILYFNFNNQLGENEEDSVSVFLQILQEDTGIPFSKISKGTVNWNVVNEEGNIVSIPKDGRGYGIDDISEEDLDKVEDFFQSNNFDLDLYNVADGPEGGIEGYRKNKMYCLLERAYKIGDDDFIKSVDLYINCAI